MYRSLENTRKISCVLFHLMKFEAAEICFLELPSEFFRVCVITYIT